MTLLLYGLPLYGLVLSSAGTAVAQTPEQAAPEAAPAAEDQESENAQEQPRPQGATFDLTLSDGSRVVGFAEEVLQEGTGGKVRLVGPAEIVYRDVKLQAANIVFDQDTKDVLAEGNVIFDQGPQRLSGDSLELNLDTELGRLVNVRGNAGTDYFFTGEEVIKTGENQYRILDGQFSSCEGTTPAWSFKASRIDLTVDGYAKVRNARFRAKKLPLLYFPYVLWPAKADRTSGFLVPKPGYSERRGASLGLAYYWAMGRSYDTTMFVDLFAGGAPTGSIGTGNYLGFGNEFRYQPSENSSGHFEGYGIDDPERDELRWRILYDHESRNLPGGMRAVIKYEDASDFDYFRDFERRGDRNSRRQLYSTGYLTGNWGSHSLNLNLDQRENFVSDGNVVTLRQLPELEYKMRSSKIPHTPFYLNMRSSLHYLDMERNERLNNSYMRGDLYPEVTLPLRTVPWFSLSLTAGGRYTWYGDSLYDSTDTGDRGDSDFRGQSLSRFVPTGNAEIVGPSFSRVFDTEGGTFSKLKHVIEPRILYSFADEYEEQDRVPVFDEVDNLRGADRARFSLFNRLLAKPTDEEQGGAFEILSLEISQDYSFDDQRPLQSGTTLEGERLASQEGPLRALLRYNPSRRTSVRVDVNYNTLFSQIDSTSLSSTFALGKTGSLGIRWSNRADAITGETTTHQMRIAARLPLGPKFRIDSQVNYDFEESFVQYQRHFLRYLGSCYTIDLEYGDFRYGSGPNARQDQEWRFALSLKNVGTFLDLNGGESESF